MTKEEKTKLLGREEMPFCTLDGRSLRLEVTKDNPYLGMESVGLSVSPIHPI